MKKFYSPLLLILIPATIFAQQNVSVTTKQRPADYEYLSAPDSLGIRHPLMMPSASRANGQILPYPIIFIHGLNSNSNVWVPTVNFMTTQHGTTYGGRFDFCLNDDASNTTTNANVYPTAGADIALYNGTWNTGDCYIVNFDVGSDGSFGPAIIDPVQVLSNQSAIAKQGVAIKRTIKEVLQLTGRDKVILIGHSMGGLAARQYLQNASIWQSDGQHHVAKLVTTGTPHGGSNEWGPLPGTPDGQSEAVRDLRTSYAISGNPGVYLSGGTESLAYMDDQVLYYFYNSDVNCNGTTGETIVGLNNKSIPPDIDYSCIVGRCTGCGGSGGNGDGIVTANSANLNNFKSVGANVFDYSGTAVVEIHTDLPEQYDYNMYGLDEPDNYSISYHVDFNTTYKGFTTFQATNNPQYSTGYDWDDYKFSIPTNTNVSVSIDNIAIADLRAQIVNTNGNPLTTWSSNGASSFSFSETLTAGNYYLEIFGVPNATSHQNSYVFELTSNATSINEEPNNLSVSVNPNPADNNLFIKADDLHIIEINIYSATGGLMNQYKQLQNKSIDISEFASGVYIAEIKTTDGSVKRRWVKM